MPGRMDRRDVLKALATGAAAGGSGLGGVLSAEQHRMPAEWRAIYPGVWKATLGAPEAHTPVRARRIPPAADGLAKMPAIERPPLPIPQYSITARGVELELPLEADERMYGFGLQMLSFQQRSKKRTIRVNADPKVDSGDSHAPVPFYVTTRGYGVLVDTFRHAAFYCGEAHPKPQNPETTGATEVNTPQKMRVRDRALPSRVLVEVPRSAGVDVYLFGGPEMRQAVERYNLFAGGGVQPPLWGLGFWYRAEMHLDAKQVLALAHDLRTNRIPCDVLGLEPGWQTHAYSCSFAWDKNRFPDPKGFVDQAAEQGFRVNLWEHAFTHPSAPIFQPLVPYSGNIAVWDGLVPDFAGAQARRIFGDYHRRELIDAGISGFKLDECDNSDFTEGWSFPDQSHFPSGVDGEQMHAQFGLRYQDAIWEPFQQRKQPTLGLVRSSGALATPYPFVLYSDLYEHRVFVRALVNAGFSGLLWCPEVRDAQNEEDLLRRLQTTVFSPLAMVNAWYIRNPPWKQMDRAANNKDELGQGWESLQARCREVIEWRMQMLPYLEEAFRAYKANGTPPFRALALDWPHEQRLSEVDDQYMIGDRMMVAPLFAGERERRIAMPPGEWQEFWTGAPARETELRVSSSFAKIPVFVKAGSLIPWAAVAQHTGMAGDTNVRVYGDGSLAWTQGDGARLVWDAARRQGDVQGTLTRWRVNAWDVVR